MLTQRQLAITNLGGGWALWPLIALSVIPAFADLAAHSAAAGAGAVMTGEGILRFAIDIEEERRPGHRGQRGSRPSGRRAAIERARGVGVMAFPGGVSIALHAALLVGLSRVRPAPAPRNPPL